MNQVHEPVFSKHASLLSSLVDKTFSWSRGSDPWNNSV